MRHGIKGRKLGRTASHRTATLRNLTMALLKHKKIKTTLAKAKELRTFVEPMITRAKVDSVANRRVTAQDINDKELVKELFTTIVEKVADRPGGYTRVVKLGQRLGDAAEMAIIELVDFSEITIEKAKAKKSEEPAEKEKKEKSAKAKADKAEAKEEVKVKKEAKPKKEKASVSTKAKSSAKKTQIANKTV
jgi:large subunit ribosomal protein L17